MRPVMPPLPWQTITELRPQTRYTVVATSFALTNRLRLIGVVRETQVFWNSFRDTPGLVGFSLRASFTRGTLSTLSAWTDDQSMNLFIAGYEHRSVVGRTAPLMSVARSRFAKWTEISERMPPTWRQASEQLRPSNF
jgi:hypothetical protein